MKTFKHIDLKYPVLERVDSPDGRVYKTENGKSYKSVTTFLAEISTDKQAGLKAWREKVGEEYANAKTKMAARRGEMFHKTIENYLLGKSAKSDNPLIQEMFVEAKKVIDKHVDNICGIEKALFSDTMGLAGTLDCVATFDGKLSIIDWKTASDTPKSEDWVYNYFLQATIYAIMFRERFGVNIKQFVIYQAVENDPKKSPLYIRDVSVYEEAVWNLLEKGISQ